MAMARRDRVAKVVAVIGDAGLRNLRAAGRDHRSRLQRRRPAFSFVRRLHPFSLASLVFALVVSISGGGSAHASEAKIWEEFSGEKALAHVERLVDFGPRPPGSDGIEKSRAYIREQLKSSGWNVAEQQFTDNTPRGQ